MFTGIIETTGTIKNIEKEGTNVHFTIESSISDELKIDQSLAHNGVCLTVIKQDPGTHVVTAIEETLNRSNIGELAIGDLLNLERAMEYNGRLDGHIVQGHVDAKGKCIGIKEVDGSTYFEFEYKKNHDHILVDKGSVCIDGVSLTVINPTENTFSVAIIPYTIENTRFQKYEIGSTINLEFDIIGKYVAKYMVNYNKVVG